MSGSDAPSSFDVLDKASMRGTALLVESVSVRFGGVQALSDVDLTAEAGQITGLIGPNGAGKTTLFNIITGLEKAGSGRVHISGQVVDGLSPFQRARLGVARTFQRLEPFGSLSARENILAAAEFRNGWAEEDVDARAVTDAILDRLGIGSVAGARVDALPTGLARLVELGRALAVKPRLLLLDEPSSGLSHSETEAVAGLLVDLVQDGMAILLVEHDVELVMGICGRIHVLDFGRIIATGTPSEIQRNEVVQTAYLGAEVEELESAKVHVTRAASPTPCGTGSEPANGSVAHRTAALELRDVRAAYGRIEVLHGVSFAVPTGCVFALLGPNGAGKSTTLQVIGGQIRPMSGCVHVAGSHVNGAAPNKLAKAGLCRTPEGRGIFPNLSVIENLRMWTYSGNCSPADVEARTFARFPVLGERRRQLAGTLSGGEQQMLALSRALAVDPSLLMLDEISMGLAPLIVTELYDVIVQLASEGITVLLVEQFARTALAVATYAAVMTQGTIAMVGEPHDVEDFIHEAYLGGVA